LALSARFMRPQLVWLGILSQTRGSERRHRQGWDGRNRAATKPWAPHQCGTATLRNCGLNRGEKWLIDELPFAAKTRYGWSQQRL